MMEDRFKSKYWGKKSKQFLTNMCKRDNGGLFALEEGLVSVDGIVCPINRKDVIEVNCTGIKDKNSTLIYEGDILKDPNWVKQESEYAPPEPLFKIEYHKPSHRLMVYITGMDEYDEIDQILNQLDECPLEIIGNIYEHHELLEVQDAR